MAKASNGNNKTGKKKTPTSIEGAGKRAAAPVAPAAFKANGDLEEQIRQRAYELYEQEGYQEGRDEEYWLRAEAEVRGRRSA